MIDFLQGLGKILITASLAVSSIFGFSSQPATPNVGAVIPVSVAVFQTSLQSSITSSATSMTLVTGTDKAGTSLSGYMCFNIDEGTSTAEFVCGTASGTAISSMIRGISPVDGDLEVTALKKAHRRGATVKATDYPALAIVSRILNGNETIPNVLSYNTEPTWTYGNHNLVSYDKMKDYADGLSFAGTSNMDLVTKGIGEEATAAEINAGTQTGGTSAELIVNPKYLKDSIFYTQLPSSDQKNALAGTSGTPSSSNKYVTNDDTATSGASKVYRLSAGGKIDATLLDGNLPAISGASLTNTIKKFGSWATPITAGTPYQATTDGFVVFSVSYSASAGSTFTVKSDASNPPTTLVGQGKIVANSGSTITVPIKSGDYILAEYNSSYAQVDVLKWIPLTF